MSAARLIAFGEQAETEQWNLVRVDVLGQGPAFQEEAEEGAQGFVAQFQGVEGQRVGLLVPVKGL